MMIFSPYKCKCGHTVFAEQQPPPQPWDDGHTCHLRLTCWCCEDSHEIWDCGLCYRCYWWAMDKQIAREFTGNESEGEVRAAYWREKREQITA